MLRRSVSRVAMLGRSPNSLRLGETGCTPIDNPAPRWSHYVFKLRRGGLEVETVHEAHGGPFAGNHARYVLGSHVTVLEQGGAL